MKKPHLMTGKFLWAIFTVMFLTAFAAFLGCMGGGGGSATVSAQDEAEITGRVEAFLTAISRGNNAALDQMLSERMQSLTGLGQGVESFTFHDFGQSLTDPDDNKAYTFFIEPSMISYVGGVLAKVPTWTQFPDGSKVSIEFQMVKESDVWLIDSLAVKSFEPGASAGTLTSVDLMPLARGNTWRYVRTSPALAQHDLTTGTAQFMVLAVDGNALTLDGASVFPVKISENHAQLGFDPTKFGVPMTGLQFGKDPGGASLITDGFFPVATAASQKELWDIIDSSDTGRFLCANFMGLFIYGSESTGFNGSLPWRATGIFVRKGSQTIQTVTFNDNGRQRSAELKCHVIGNQAFALPARNVNTLRIDISARLSDTGEVIYTSWFFEPGLGLVAQVQYFENTGLPEMQEFFVEGIVNNATIGVPGSSSNLATHEITNLTPSTTLIEGTPVSHTFVATGGSGSYLWSLTDAPVWLSIDPQTGCLSGTPDTSGDCCFTVCVTDSNNRTVSYPVEWVVQVSDNPPLSSTKAITAFNFASPAATGVVNETAKTVAITVPFGTDVTALIPTITHTGASISPATGVAQNFTGPVVYTVTAADASTQAYTVTVTVAANPAKAITAFNFASPAATGVVNETAKAVAITVPFGTDVTALVPTITHTGASISPATGVAQNFTGPVVYTVTAADASTQAYTVTVTVAANPAKAITVFNFASPAATGVVNETAKTVAITVPYGTNVTALAPTITHTGAGISPGSGVIQSFVAPVEYTVTAADGTSQAYIVTVYTTSMPVVTAPTNTPQTLRSGLTSASTVQMNVAGNIYLIKNLEPATTQAEINSAVSFGKAFIGVSNAVAGTAYTITVPAGPIDGLYDIVGIDSYGNVSEVMAGWLTIDNTAPTDQDTVFATAVFVNGGAPVAINPSDDPNNTVWLAPSGTTSFVVSSSMTSAGGTAPSINAPPTEDVYYLYVIDAVGNVSAQSIAAVTVDNTPPAVVLSDDQSDAFVRDADTVTITATFTEADQIDEVSGAPTIQIGGLINSVMTKQNNLVWTYIWDVPAGNDGIQAVTISATDRAGNTNTPATGRTSYTIDNIAPTDENVVMNVPAMTMGGATLTITPSSDPNDTLWLAPIGTTVFATGPTMTFTDGAATSIIVPASEGMYYLYVIDQAGNISLPSSNGVSVDNTAPTEQDSILTASVFVQSNTDVSISNGESGSFSLAPLGTTNFTPSETVTTTDAANTTITSPALEGEYHLYVMDMVGNVSAPSTAVVTVDDTPPTNQDTVLAASVSVKSSVAVAITSSGDAGNNVWLAPSGTVNFFLATDMTKAAGTSTSITAPGIEGVYYIYIIDAAGNVSSPSTAYVTVDNTAPTNQDTVLSASVSVQSAASVAITSSGDAGNSVWLAPFGTTTFAPDSTITTAGGTATTISAPSLEGQYRLFIIDQAGNISAPSTAIVTVDSTEPTAVFITPPTGSVYATYYQNLTIGGSDVVAYKIQLDAGAWSAETPVAVATTAINLAYGAHTLSVLGKDSAGNWQTTATTNNWSISSYYVGQFGSTGTGDGQFTSPCGIARDSANNIYVVDSGNNRVMRFNSAGNYVDQFGSLGTGNGQFSIPYGIVIDSTDTIFILDTGNNRVQKFDSSSSFNYISQFTVSSTQTAMAIAIDSSDYMYVTDAGANTITKYDNVGTPTGFQINAAGSGEGQLSNPRGIAISGTNILVADGNNRRIQEFNASGGFVRAWSSGPGFEQFYLPTGVAVRSNGNVVVTDFTSNNAQVVQEFDSSGIFIRTIGIQGTGDGELRTPSGVMEGPNNYIFIVDTQNNRVQYFNDGP